MKIEISDNKKWQYSLTIKMILLAIMGLFLLVPLEMIKSIIRERQKNAENIKKDIALQWSGQQTVSGPVLNIPVNIYPAKKEVDPYRTVFHIMPETLAINGTVNTEKRHRSIYQAVVYSTELNLTGEFVIPEINSGERSEILWSEAYYSMGISDNRGLKGGVSLKADSSVINAVPGLKDNDLFSTGITFPAVINEKSKLIRFSLPVNLSGSESLSFTPMGKTTDVKIQSPWSSPGFTGSFLPTERTITESGFDAKWQVTNLNRNFPQSWTGNSFKPVNDSFGVDFVLQVDHYQKSLRSAKYGILFIVLTFLALLFAELTINEKIHIFHYLQLALGLVLFFSLLNALSEQVGFNLAYLISASSTILLILIFLRALIPKNRPLIIIAGLLVLLYSFIFVLLTLNDYAYLAGNIGLFILLAITMRLSLKLDLVKKDSSGVIPE